MQKSNISLEFYANGKHLSIWKQYKYFFGHPMQKTHRPTV
jgi:hypothetical protein